MYGNVGQHGGYATFLRNNLEQSTLATWLHDAGYRTALIGKYLNGYPSPKPKSYVPPGWDYWVSPNLGDPYSEYFYSLNVNGTTTPQRPYPMLDANAYLVDALSRHAVAFIRESAANHPEQPFFAYITPFIPHTPATPPVRYAAFPLNGLIQAPRTPSFDVEVANPPPWLARLYARHPSLTLKSMAAMDVLYRNRVRSMLAVEDLVGAVIAELQAIDALKNTYVFFASDNGYHQGQHVLDSGKNTEFDEDLRVPLVVRGPNVPPGAAITQLTANVDYAPTIAELAGARAPSFVDGRSLVPFLSGATPQQWRKALLLEHRKGGARHARRHLLNEPPEGGKLYDPDTFVGLRTVNVDSDIDLNNLTYVEYDRGAREVYDLTIDPDELSNAYSSVDPRGEALSTWLGTLRNASGQALRDAEQIAP